MSRMIRTTLLSALVFVATTIATTGFAEEKSFQLNLQTGAVPKAERLVQVAKGDTVRIKLTSDQPGELHLHAYRVVAKLTDSKQAVDVSFKAHATGRFRFEWHAASSKAPTGHHHEAVATLEVRPT
jgi:uncharacterized cupredoxin-like copper-binding protein